MIPLYITGAGSISSLGASMDEVGESYRSPRARHEIIEVQDSNVAVFRAAREPLPSHFDRVTRFSLFAARAAVDEAGWSRDICADAAVCVGSARGATDTFESLHRSFLSGGRLPSQASPLTTMGGIASATAASVGSNGVSLGTSMTCASFMQSLLVVSALLQSGRSKRGILCGAEAPLTPFTIGQMKSLRIYSTSTDSFPCRPLANTTASPNTMVLGEGAACYTLETGESLAETNAIPKARILGIGFARETNETPTGMEPDGLGLKRSMTAALADASLASVDAVVLHAPGTKVGDLAELSAIRNVFPDPPALFSTKYLTGHTFGASGALGIELAMLLANSSLRPRFPYETVADCMVDRPISTVMINAAGFGGVITSAVIGPA